MGVEPHIGIRVRLHSKGAGKWTTSGGENAKFGLSTTNLVAASEMLKAQGLAHCLKLVHFHVGSQVPDISTIKRAVREAARYYAKLSKMGHALGYLDVGGGLGVDYDGSRTSFDSSTNYSLQEYCNDVVYNIMEVCDSEAVAHPAIVSEGGRAIVAHHSVLVVEAFGSIEKDVADDQDRSDGQRSEAVARHHRGEAPAQARQSARDLARRAADQGRDAADVQSRPARSRIEGEDRSRSTGSSPGRSSPSIAA